MSNKANYIDQHIAVRLRCLREKKEISLNDLDKAIKAPPSTVSNYESLRQRIKAERLYLLGKALDVDISYFFEGLSRQPPAKNLFSLNPAAYNAILSFVMLLGQIADKSRVKEISKLVKALVKSHLQNTSEKFSKSRWKYDDPLFLTHLQRALEKSGLTTMGAFHPQENDGVPIAAGTVVLVGNGGPEMWKAFSVQEVKGANPLDRWIRKALDKVADDFGAEVLFPFDRPFLPFTQWAERASLAHTSPLGIVIHPEFGLWHAYRGALVFKKKMDLPPKEKSVVPCDSCEEKPCLSACPVQAFKDGEFNKDACMKHLSFPEGHCCMANGCRSRNACFVGDAYRYDPAQIRFHMKALLP